MEDIKKQLTTMKLHLDQIYEWATQASDMIYALEDRIMDIEDKGYKKYSNADTIDFLKFAASGIHDYMMQCPPRQNSSRCGTYDSAAVGFYQSEKNSLTKTTGATYE